MKTNEVSLDSNKPSSNYKKTEWSKMSCPEVASKIKEIKNTLTTSKMPKEERLAMDKDLELGEKYYKINCNVKVNVEKPIDIIKSVEKPDNDLTTKQIKSIGKPPKIISEEKKEISNVESKANLIKQTKKEIKDDTEKAIKTLSTWKLFLLLGIIGGGIYLIKRKWK